MSEAEDSGRDFGDEQDMAVVDKPNPTLGPTEASQDMATLNQIIVPVGAYTDPNNPAAASASVNLTLDKSPVEHPEDYGATTLEAAGVEADGGSMGMVTQEDEGVGPRQESEGEERDDWKKDDWKNQAEAYGLATSGTVEELRDRIEEHEAEMDDDETQA